MGPVRLVMCLYAGSAAFLLGLTVIKRSIQEILVEGLR